MSHHVTQPNTLIRTKIMALEHALRSEYARTQQPPPEYPVTHHFAPGMYCRELFVPKDNLVVAKIHKHEHLSMLMQGRVSVVTEDGMTEYAAPAIMVSKAGTKRVAFTHEDTIWVTVHVTQSTDLAVIEEEVIAKTFEEFDALRAATQPALSHMRVNAVNTKE
jgi:hypothetical protein